MRNRFPIGNFLLHTYFGQVAQNCTATAGNNMSPIFHSLSWLWLMQINYNFLIRKRNSRIPAPILLFFWWQRQLWYYCSGIREGRLWDNGWLQMTCAYERLNRINQWRLLGLIFGINNSIQFAPYSTHHSALYTLQSYPIPQHWTAASIGNHADTFTAPPTATKAKRRQ